MSPTAAALVCSAWSIRSHVQEPSASVIDSESVKADAVVGADSHRVRRRQAINGRKGHVVVDTLGPPVREEGAQGGGVWCLRR
ncbi:hypothetical protein [Streptomyces dubilierae]|uniref:Transposase IS4-like domain-containing protein n=1 Tax=Streptomyces dubilierae TaxID=3075533 RepID=A0ABU2P1M9_9ACTN|nr:hypothetical protein [Streptomyces sp. DSM 41921]MDT0386046.1 hypothetical protein [Streptomyces sp. DSM 41921]